MVLLALLSHSTFIHYGGSLLYCTQPIETQIINLMQTMQHNTWHRIA